VLPPDAKIGYPEFERDEKEKIFTIMEKSGSDAGENCVAALEKKVNEMEALVEGLTQELLDLKAINMEISKHTEECSLQELKCMQMAVQGTQVPPGAVAVGGTAPQGSMVMVRSGARDEDAEPQPPAETAMDMIMQTDGTMKLEPRRGNKNCIVASVGYGTSANYGKNKKGISVKPRQSKLICAVEKN
jgi:hypothetical protein